MTAARPQAGVGRRGVPIRWRSRGATSNGTSMTEAAVHRHVACRQWVDASAGETSRAVPEEIPVAFRVNCADYAVMLASPADLEDFARGFAVTEGLVERIADIASLETALLDQGAVVRLQVSGDPMGDRTSRRLAGASGCGLCGVENLEQAIRPVPSVGAGGRFAPTAIERAVDALREWQPHNRAGGALHAAAFADADGAIRLSREDVGRHNALDKLIGAMAANRVDPQRGFAVMSSRCSYELVQKAARANIPLLCTVSAPTGLAVRLAEQAGVTLISLARGGSFLVLAGAHRIDWNTTVQHG